MNKYIKGNVFYILIFLVLLINQILTLYLYLYVDYNAVLYFSILLISLCSCVYIDVKIINEKLEISKMFSIAGLLKILKSRLFLIILMIPTALLIDIIIEKFNERRIALYSEYIGCILFSVVALIYYFKVIKI